MVVVGERSLPALISAHEPYIAFSLPCAAEGMIEWLWWAPSTQPRSIHLRKMSSVWIFTESSYTLRQKNGDQ